MGQERTLWSYAKAGRKKKLNLSEVVGDGTLWNIPVYPNDPAIGPENALVTIVEFCDFQCPYCRKLTGTLEQVLKERPQNVRLVFKNFPLSFHSEARTAALASLAANRQGKFWQMHDRLFRDQANLNRDSMLKAAEDLGLDTSMLMSDMNSTNLAEMVDRHILEGERAGVNGTPALFINGIEAQVRTPEGLVAMIDAEMDKARSVTVAPGQLPYDTIVGDGKIFLTFAEDAATFDLTLAPTYGRGDGTYQFVLFSDFQCPYCAKFKDVALGLVKKYKGKATLYFKHFPLPMHDMAHKAAEAAVGAHKGGKFWEMHDLLFANYNSLNEQNITQMGIDLGLDDDEFFEAILKGKFKEDVDTDIAEGKKAGVEGTPTLFVNGRRYQGRGTTAQEIAEDIDKYLATP